MKEEIIEKAKYCLSCPKRPCHDGCPLGNDTMEFIRLIKEGKDKEAYELLCNTTVLQSICGRVCPHEKQCQGKCIRKIKNEAVEIGNLESYIGDLAIENNWKIPKFTSKKIDKKVAVIGAGPSGITCASFLARAGYDVTIFEKHNHLGGLLYHGIPDFRLSKDILEKAINKILELGIKVELEKELGKNLKLEELEKEYDAIYIAIGANVSSKMNIEGENLNGVYGGNELLESNIHPNYINKNVAIIGGGNVAIDTARTVKRLGANKVTIIYRRAMEQMPAERKEIKEAQEEKIDFLFQTNILKIIGSKEVEKIECIKTELKKKENEERLSPVNIEGSNYLLDMDYVIMAVGSKTEKSVLDKLNLELDKWNCIKVDENHQTSNPKIFSGGDVAGNKATVAWAARAGREAANSIIKFLE